MSEYIEELKRKAEIEFNANQHKNLGRGNKMLTFSHWDALTAAPKLR